MEKQFVTTSDSPTISLEIHGDLKLKGWDEQAVLVKTSSSDELNVEQQDDGFTIRCMETCKVMVPSHAVVIATALHGNAVFKSLEGPLTIKECHGDLELRSVGPTAVENVQGNLSARNITGDFKISRVDGNLTTRDVAGDFTAEQVSGNLLLDDVDGGASGKADGNITVRIDPSPDHVYDFAADGNLLFRLPNDASAEVLIKAANRITVSVGDQQISKTLEEGEFTLTLGEGDARLVLSAEGNLVLAGQVSGWQGVGDFDFKIDEDLENMTEGITEQITRQIDAQMEMMESQLNAHLENLSVSLGSAGLSEEQRQRIAQRAREASERATARAQEKVQRAQERIDRKVNEARRRAEQRGHNAERRARSAERHPWGFGINFPTPPAPPPHDPVSEDERMIILRMLEQKKISLEEADQLLTALEGKES